MRKTLLDLSNRLPIELKLLSAAGTSPFDEAAEKRAIDLAGQIEDWRAFQKAAVRHQMQGFVQHRMMDFAPVPDALRSRWANAVRKRARTNLLQAQMTGELHNRLLDAGIPNLVLKGLPLAIGLYGSLTIKRSGDIDLLVPPNQGWQAVQCLVEAGFRLDPTGKVPSQRQITAVMRHFKEITLRNDRGILVDLHWRLVSPRNVLSGIDPFATARSQRLEQVGAIKVLGEDEEFAYLCAHGALSDWSRLKWLNDVVTMANKMDQNQLVARHQFADRMGAGPAVLQALALREVLYGIAMPDKLIAKLETIYEPEFLNFPLYRMREPYRPATSRQSIDRIRRQEHMRAVLYGDSRAAKREWREHLLAQPDVLAVPLPRALDALYILLRPFFWAARKLGSRQSG